MKFNAWREVLLEDVAAELTVGFVGSMTSEYVDLGIPFLRSKNVEPYGIKWDDMRFINREFHERLKKSALAPGDVVIVRTGKPGAAALIPKSLPEANCSDVVIVRPGSQLDARFLVYYLNSLAVHHVNAHLVGAVQQHFNVGSARKLSMKLPPLAQQQAIAQILGTLDDKIELNQQMNHTLEAIARALFKSWFIDFDPVRAKMDGQQPAGMDAETAALFPAEFEDSALGKIPKGWKAVPLPEAIEVNPTRSLAKGKLAPYLDMQNMPTQGHRPNSWIYREFGSGTKFIQGDTLLARITPCLDNGKTAFVDFLPEGEVGWGSTEYIVLRPKPPLPVEFGYFLARSEELRTYAIQNRTGSSGRQRVPVNCFMSFLLAVPSNPVARRFGDVILPIMRIIKANSEQIISLTAIRNALLPKLLSGEIKALDRLNEQSLNTN